MFISYPLPLIVGYQQNVNFPGPSKDSLVLLAGILWLEGNRSPDSVCLSRKENLLSHMLLLFGCPVVSNSLRPHGGSTPDLCPSPSSEVCPSSYLLPWWFHPAISSYDTLFFCPQSFPASGTFPMSQLSTSDDQNSGASASVLPVNSQGWSPLGLAGLISLLSKGLSGVFFSTAVWRHQFLGALPSLQSNSHNHTWPLGRPQPWLYRPLSTK